jgi:hypothetical protein
MNASGAVEMRASIGRVDSPALSYEHGSTQRLLPHIYGVAYTQFRLL